MPSHAVLASLIVLALTTTSAAQMPAPPRVHNRTLSAVTEGERQVFRLDARDGDGVAWWPDVPFTTGTIALDIRGRDVAQGSFVGVAFHGADEQTYEAIYFRPFNFRTDDPARRLRAVQYVSHPSHPWPVLRERHPGVYEKPVNPPPDPGGWFHARIVVDADTVRVFVDRAPSAALEVKRLTARSGGWIGLWVGNTSPGDFANVAITPSGPAVAAGLPSASHAGLPAAAAALPAGPADLSGTYVGHIVPQEGGDPFAGRFVIVDRGATVEVSLGPSADEMMPASKVRRSGAALTFEADPPGETTNHLVFEVTVAGNALTGSLVQTRDGQTRRGRVAFTRQ